MQVVDQLMNARSEGLTSGSIPVGNPGPGTWPMARAPQWLQRWEMATAEPKLMSSGESTAAPGSLHVPRVFIKVSPAQGTPELHGLPHATEVTAAKMMKQSIQSST